MATAPQIDADTASTLKQVSKKNLLWLDALKNIDKIMIINLYTYNTINQSQMTQNITAIQEKQILREHSSSLSSMYLHEVKIMSVSPTVTKYPI